MVQGCWRAVGSSFGKSITFKTTVKGTNMLMKNGLGDLWMPCVCFLGLLASLGFGLHKVATITVPIILLILNNKPAITSLIIITAHDEPAQGSHTCMLSSCCTVLLETPCNQLVVFLCCSCDFQWFMYQNAALHNVSVQLYKEFPVFAFSYADLTACCLMSVAKC